MSMGVCTHVYDVVGLTQSAVIMYSFDHEGY